MDSGKPDKAIGFAQEMPGGYVFEVGNAWVTRRIHCIAGRIGTTSLENGSHGEEYLEETLTEFEIVLTGEGQRVTLEAKDFKFTGYETPEWDDTVRKLRLRLETELNGTKLSVSVFYEARAGGDFTRKWLEIEPCDLEGWIIRRVTLEKMKFRELVEGVVPHQRYLSRYENSEDKVHSQPENAITAEPERRFVFGDLSRAVVGYWGYGEGLYFFTQSLTGDEIFHRPTGLLMKQREWAPLTEGCTTGPSVIGAYKGPPEVGFKRYNEHLTKHWCAIDEKSVPVTWNTWLVTLAGNMPVHSDYDRQFLLGAIERMDKAGFYESLHLDLGWEAGNPLSYDESKFPNGLSEIARCAQDIAGLDMSYWVNPFSCSYWKPELESERPDYLVPGKVSPRSSATALCVMTEYFDYVRQRLIDLALGLNARVIYWDGNDWNIPDCSSTHHDHRDQEELQVKATRRLADICEAAHEARHDLIIAAFSLPFDNHRLCALDAQAISDTHTFPTGQSELIQRQQVYQMTFEHPYRAIWGSWYGVNWHEAGDNNLATLPIAELIHAEMSMIGNGLAQAGASIDLDQARPEFLEFLRRLLGFRKHFEKYFNVYQHVLGFPDGQHVDGSGHMIDGSGFIVLVNPTRQTQSVKLPLGEPELELKAGKKHKLSDWSSLDRVTPMEPVTIKDAPEIDLLPLEVKYFGVNI